MRRELRAKSQEPTQIAMLGADVKLEEELDANYIVVLLLLAACMLLLHTYVVYTALTGFSSSIGVRSKEER